jgi:Uri superfamily endonuclease
MTFMKSPRRNTQKREKGIYLLLFRLDGPTEVVLGSKAKRTLFFPRGSYAYVGSALGGGGLPMRLLRHLNLRPKKTDKWNIDKLTMSPSYQPMGAITIADPDGIECCLVPALRRSINVEAAAPRFGNGDDWRKVQDGLIRERCETHTWRLLGAVRPKMLAKAMHGEWRPMSYWRRLAKSIG